MYYSIILQRNITLHFQQHQIQLQQDHGQPLQLPQLQPQTQQPEPPHLQQSQVNII